MHACNILTNISFILILTVPAFLPAFHYSCTCRCWTNTSHLVLRWQNNRPSLPSFLAHVRLLNSHGIFKPSRMACVLLIIPGSCYCRDNLSSHWPVRGSFLTRDLHQRWACAGNSPGHWHVLWLLALAMINRLMWVRQREFSFFAVFFSPWFGSFCHPELK